MLPRLYYQMSSNSSNMPRLCRLACGMPNLDICDVEKNPKSNNVRYKSSLQDQLDSTYLLCNQDTCTKYIIGFTDVVFK